MLILCFNLRNTGWGKRCPVNEAEVWRARSQKNSAGMHASLVPRFWYFFYNFFSSPQKSKYVSPLKAQSGDQWEKTNPASVLSLVAWVALPWACPGGNSCQEPSNTQTWLPFCISFFQTLPQTYLPMYLSYILAVACSCRLHNLCLNSNHINVSCLSTSSTWHEISLYSSTPHQTFQLHRMFLFAFAN